MKYIVENWFVIVGLIAVLAAGGYAVYVFVKMPSDNERAAQRAAVSRTDAAAAVLPNICLDFFRFLYHAGKLRAFRFVKAVVADAEDTDGIGQQRDNFSKVALPVAAGAGKQQDDRGSFCAEGIDFHLPTPFRKPLFAIFSVSSDSS